MFQPTRSFSFKQFRRALDTIDFERAPQNFWDHFEFVEREADINEFVPGTQSIVGLIQHKEKHYLKCFYKLSLFDDNSVYHEYGVLMALARGAGNCPNFMRAFGVVDYASAISILDSFDEKVKSPRVLRPILLLEYLPGTEVLADTLQFSEEDERAHILSLIQQSLSAVRIMRALNITHYDLHCENILVQQCSTSFEINYTGAPGFDGAPESARRVPTHGYIAIVIDFGYSYAPPIEDPAPLYCNYSLLELGYLCDRFTPFTDYVRLMYDIHNSFDCNPTTANASFRRMLRDSVNKTKGIQKSRGYDRKIAPKQPSAMHAFQFDIESVFASEERILLFHEEDWISNLQSLINYPLADIGAPYTFREIKAEIKTFEKEWLKIEQEIVDIPTLNWLFKQITQSMRAHRDVYLADPDQAVATMRAEFFAAAEQVVRFFDASKCNFSELIGALYVMAHCLENYLFKKCNEKYEYKMHRQFSDCAFRAETVDNFMLQVFQKYSNN